MADVVLDACILVDLERQDRRTRVAVDELVGRGSALLVAGATYTEVWRGHRHGHSWHMEQALGAVEAVPTTEEIGRLAGELLEKAGAEPALRFDAIVVATAAVAGADVLTDDLQDIKILVAYANVRVLSAL
jgi:predicted nucleic acid-binding protein